MSPFYPKDKSPYSLQVLFSILIFILIFPTSSASEATINWQSEMLTRVNKVRSDKGLPLLRTCKSLEFAAQKYSEYMAKENFLSHTGKDGTSLGDRLTKQGYLWENSNSYIGENIAAGQKTVREVVAGWVKSPPHYKNIVSKNFTHVGFGQAKSRSSTYKIYWVQNFGSGVKC